MKQHVRAFAVGLLTSGILLLAIYIFGNNSSGNLEDMDPEELISTLENHGYAVLTQDEYIAYSVNQETSDENDSEAKEDSEAANDSDENKDEDSNDEKSSENENSDDNDSESSEDEESDVIDVEVTLENGMPPSNISDSLEEAGIIDDAREFNDYLEDNDLSGSVKPGTYKVDSEMSFSEIAEIITTYTD
ncbi:endolytic transglycosylase MltG [Oceanobacillus sp. J11TS1]|uniref:endolytic transglycosylase MltG n=1 Tax=Oceanobacillus sp. J11TS1 TaxID=2807191 RepID=UPI001B0EA909|nr:endolytic transglycosylase MltG [Oceanobacillus sp. J11TS1]GIO23128.1 hypothetical protein J11TS1_17090 [Oceanobacillus sp. J11TS1]